MDLLDQYAQAAIAGFCANPCYAEKDSAGRSRNEQRANDAWEVAQAMMALHDKNFLIGQQRMKS